MVAFAEGFSAESVARKESPEGSVFDGSEVRCTRCIRALRFAEDIAAVVVRKESSGVEGAVIFAYKASAAVVSIMRGITAAGNVGNSVVFVIAVRNIR